MRLSSEKQMLSRSEIHSDEYFINLKLPEEIYNLLIMAGSLQGVLRASDINP